LKENRDADRMNMESANALLKTLEEPPANTVLLLTATHTKSLPDTIVSRCRVLSFSLHPQDILNKYLEQSAVPQQNHDHLLMIAQGRSEHLFRLLKDPDHLESEKKQFQEISRLFFLDDPFAKFVKAEELSAPEKQDELRVFLENFVRFLRSVLVEKSAEKPFDIAQRISFSHIAELFRELSNVQRGLRANANRKLLLEHFFFLIP
jgi:DNA polymerase-3 subunit delta'